MCGIAGYVSQNGRPIDEAVFLRMTDILAHRGPDDSGIKYFSDSPFLALSAIIP